MTEPSRPARESAHDLAAAMRRTHRSVLVLLAACGAGILLRGFGGEEPPPDRILTTLAVGLGLGTVVLRRLGASPVIEPRTSFFYLLGALVLSAALGLLGAWVAFTTGAPRTGLMFTLAGAIFAIRPLTPLRTERAPGARS